MPATPEQAVIMLASHFYESRDGSTGGFFADKDVYKRQILDGHAGSDENFTTIEYNAAESISFIDSNFGGCLLYTSRCV